MFFDNHLFFSLMIFGVLWYSMCVAVTLNPLTADEIILLLVRLC